MSDPLSQPEIEDVLSSIRRLVSHEVARAKSERLILTPALRVVGDGPADPAAPVVAAPSADAIPAPAPAAPPATDGEDLRARVQRAMTPSEAPDADAASPTPDAATATASESADPALDDAALRGVIAEVLRDELRGALGERMTRNIRKLVRAEVARALAERG